MAPKKDNGKPTQPPASAAMDPPGPENTAAPGDASAKDENNGTAKASDPDSGAGNQDGTIPPIPGTDEEQNTDTDEAVYFDQEWLEGLTFSTGETMVLDGEAKKRTVIRPLEMGDVLAWAKYDDAVVLVTADGQKHRVEK